ncbi:MAG: ThuA domain-containing protein [Oscillospiraceae bacterium]|jgi:trehalose utilization protein|nr:ThuA domain-containing protein [Oscillospiraceae bacterium]
MIRVTIWNEFYKPNDGKPAELSVYPNGIHGAIADFLTENDSEITVTTRTMHDKEFGFDNETLENTDVLLYWSHIVQDAIPDEIVERVQRYALSGMGLIVLHSGHASKLFRRLMGTNTNRLRWHEDALPCRIWKIDYAHPIAEGLDDYFELAHEETYGEHFDIPQPDDLVFVSWFPSGEVFRSGCTWHRGLGRVFYFQPGHETLESYYDKNVQKVICNAVRWAYRPNVGSYSYVTDETKAIVM